MLLSGLICTQLVITQAMKERPRSVEFLVHALIFCVLTYLAAYFAYEALGRAFSILQVGASQLLYVDFVNETLSSSVAALVYCHSWIYGSTHRCMT